MSLREFLFIDSRITTSLSECAFANALANSRIQKVLRIDWKGTSDMLTNRCDLPCIRDLTKGTVVRQTASVYQPFGWMVQLLTRATRFQQQLWKRKIAWDDIPWPEVQA